MDILSPIRIGFISIQSMILGSKSAHESLWFTSHVTSSLLSRFEIISDKEFVRKTAYAFDFCVLAVIIAIVWKKSSRSFYD